MHPWLTPKAGFFGDFGGAFVPEILRATLEQLEKAWHEASADPDFWHRYCAELATYCGRPTPVTHLDRLSKHLGGAQIWLKREDLNHTGAHKANNVMGQGMLMQRMGKRRVIAETGAGQHGVATATMAARLGFECRIYMGAEDVHRQRSNVFWMEQMGAEVIPVQDGSQTLKDAINACMRDWVGSMETTHYCLGTACGPHPFPQLVAYFQQVIGIEARAQFLEATGGLPDAVYACVGGGSNATGLYRGFLDDAAVKLMGVEAGGHGIEGSEHAARIASPGAHIGVAHGYKSWFLQDQDGQMRKTHSVAAGLDYVGISPILAHLHQQKRLGFVAATDVEVVEACRLLMRTEGIIPALESAHGLAGAIAAATSMPQDTSILVGLSGRGDKDIFTIADALQDPSWYTFLAERAAQGASQ